MGMNVCRMHQVAYLDRCPVCQLVGQLEELRTDLKNVYDGIKDLQAVENGTKTQEELEDVYGDIFFDPLRELKGILDEDMYWRTP